MYLQITFIALAQFGWNLWLRFSHILNGTFHGNDAFQIEAVNIINRRYGDLGVSFLHDPFDRVAAFTNDTTN